MKSETPNLINIKKIIYKYCKLNNIPRQKTKKIYYLTIAYCYNDRCFFNLLKNTTRAIFIYEQKINFQSLIQLFNTYYIQNNPMAIFIGFLRKYDAFDSLKKELIIQHKNYLDAMFCQSHIENWISFSFSWNKTKEGYDFWNKLNNKWHYIIAENKHNFFNITNDDYDDYQYIKIIISNNKYIDKFTLDYLK